MVNEEWKDIVGFEKVYQVSNLGRVRSLITDAAYSTPKGSETCYRGHRYEETERWTVGGKRRCCLCHAETIKANKVGVHLKQTVSVPKIKKQRVVRRYWTVGLVRKNHKTKTVYVHTLVLCAFVGPKPLGLQAAHLDGNRNNNSASNLRWVSGVENMRHRDLHGRTCRGDSHVSTKISSSDVAKARKIYAKRKITHSSLAAMFGVSRSLMNKIVNGKARQ